MQMSTVSQPLHYQNQRRLPNQREGTERSLILVSWVTLFNIACTLSFLALLEINFGEN